MYTDAMGIEGYSLLKDLRLEIEVKEGTFSLCFWVYLMNSTTFPATIIQQASCLRNFSLDVVLSDAFDQPDDKENEVFASLLYADTGAPVENTTDEEAPFWLATME